jgi:predicted transposase YdaD
MIASFVLDGADDLAWIKEQFQVIDDPIRQSPIFQEILQEGRQEGLQEGLLTARQTLLFFVARFSNLGAEAEKIVAEIHDLKLLQALTLRIASTQDEQEARSYLLHPETAGE